MRWQPTEWEKIFKAHYLMRNLYPEYIEILTHKNVNGQMMGRDTTKDDKKCPVNTWQHA